MSGQPESGEKSGPRPYLGYSNLTEASEFFSGLNRPYEPLAILDSGSAATESVPVVTTPDHSAEPEENADPFDPEENFPESPGTKICIPTDLTPFDGEIPICDNNPDCPCKWEARSNLDKRLNLITAEDFRPESHPGPERNPGTPDELEAYVSHTYDCDIAIQISPGVVILENGLFISIN